MNIKRTISFIAISTMMLGSFMALSQDVKRSFYSRNDGSYESTASWSTTDHKGNRAGINPGCKVSTDFIVMIADSLISECNPMIINGNAVFKIHNGGKLEINGDLEIYGNAILNIDEASTLIVNGNIMISGGAKMTLNGRLNAHGNITVTGNGEACGTGQVNVSGSISGRGWCSSIHVLPIELIDFTAELFENTNIKLSWSPKLGTPSDQFIIERSNNGMTFTEIAKLKETDLKSNDNLKTYLDTSLKIGTYYYRITQVNFSGVYRASTMIAASIIQNDKTDACELLVNPNPCVPSCTVTLNDCPESVYKTFILDGAGRTISELVPISKAKHKIEYHLNKDNFTMPGVYIIRTTSSTDSLYKKVMIR